ncbi:MAG: hypothetical protein E7176_02895 [Erysipelotrichaceae bacterium]|nr:hypothetical protein [Erysipelotrichaceae bacterium]
MDKIIKENERRIERFDSKYYLSIKNYSMAAAISALETTNEIQKSYFKWANEKHSVGDNILRLYALLQGLFVSVDSLYSLALSLTKSKSFININNNKDLRQLRYIRNDVVGHPSNRVFDSDTLAYCILDNESITPQTFSYDIYTKDDVIKKEINVIDILKSYYQEANSLLDELYKLAANDKNKTSLEAYISVVVDDYYMNRDYLASFDNFIKEYKKLYPNSKKEQHRVLWRKDLIDKLVNYKAATMEEKNVIFYCIGLELIKIYELVYKSKYKVETFKQTPMYISSLYRFLNKNKSMYSYLDYLDNSNHPLFITSIKALKKEATIKRVNGAVSYLDMILKQYEKNEHDMVYALVLPIKEYKRKK